MTDVTKYKLNHSMLRVKDPVRSVKFYEHLGMKQIHKIENPDANFDLYFLAYDGPGAVSAGKHWTDREGIIELTHNYGTEKDDNFNITNGNTDPYKGFGHVCISVDNMQAACERIDKAGLSGGWQKKVTDGRMRSIAFVKDPDGYWVEIIAQKPVTETEDVKETDPSKYRMNHTMIRVKDHEKSLKFYQDVMGMRIMRVSENKDANFNLYFLAYSKDAPPQASANGVNPVADHEGILELTWNYGTEKDDTKYHNGNDQPQGFGHICITVDDLHAACKRFDDHGVTFKKRPEDGRMRNIAFLLDPDGYWIEVVPNDSLQKTSNI
ncbi:hypothetical protein MBLNU459_g5887t1 [Dothideomycetes sp. NU459]